MIVVLGRVESWGIAATVFVGNVRITKLLDGVPRVGHVAKKLKGRFLVVLVPSLIDVFVDRIDEVNDGVVWHVRVGRFEFSFVGRRQIARIVHDVLVVVTVVLGAHHEVAKEHECGPTVVLVRVLNNTHNDATGVRVMCIEEDVVVETIRAALTHHNDSLLAKSVLFFDVFHEVVDKSIIPRTLLAPDYFHIGFQFDDLKDVVHFARLLASTDLDLHEVFFLGRTRLFGWTVAGRFFACRRGGSSNHTGHSHSDSSNESNFCDEHGFCSDRIVCYFVSEKSESRPLQD